MRKLMLGTAMAAVLAAGGCATISNDGITAAEVQSAAQTACGFLPTASSIAALLTANAAVVTAEGVASIICAAVTAAPPAAKAKLGGSTAAAVTKTIFVNGPRVTITGTFGGRLRAGAPVAKTVLVNGIPVTIRGTFTK